jgi:outer membrane protein OmpA-like peptidoglycan-associated protein
MLRLAPFLTIAAIALAGAASTPQEARGADASCDSIAAKIAAARKAGDVERLPSLLAQARDIKSGCAERALLCLGRSVAIAYVDKAYAFADAGKRPGEIEAILNRAKNFSSPWALSALLGDIEFDRAAAGDKGAYVKAAADYEAALNDIHEERICASYDEPPDPPAAQIARLVKRTSEAKLLAGTFQLTRTRDGECGGVFLTKIRDFEPKSTPLPIEFEFDSATLTEKGEQAAQAVLECAGREKFAQIKLTGHTDMKGDDAYNMELSARRLAAVRDYLVRAGYAGRIELVPLGKREPFELDDPSQHGQAEIDQLNRRVELREASK